LEFDVDLYVRHTSDPVNALLRRLLPLLEPTRSHPILPNFLQKADIAGTQKKSAITQT
jgi:hypothetical protein